MELDSTSCGTQGAEILIKKKNQQQCPLTWLLKSIQTLLLQFHVEADFLFFFFCITVQKQAYNLLMDERVEDFMASVKKDNINIYILPCLWHPE